MIESPNFLTENSESNTCIDKTFTVMKPIVAWTGMGWEVAVGVGEGLSQIKNWGGVILLLWHRISCILTYTKFCARVCVS